MWQVNKPKDHKSQLTKQASPADLGKPLLRIREVARPEIASKQAAVTGQLSKFSWVNLDKPTENRWLIQIIRSFGPDLHQAVKWRSWVDP
jgi:hypothetical protein